MKNRIQIITTVIFLGLLFQSCEKDNLNGPDARFYGEIRDSETGELVEQEIINGSRIYYIEQGWANPEVQEMVIKKDGTFRNDMMFSASYKIVLNRGNYVPQDTLKMDITSGNNEHIFKVTPYLRILDPQIRIEGRKIIATFKLKQITKNSVQRISLFAHAHEDVSNSMNTVNITQDLNRQVTDNELFELSIDLDEYSNTLMKGKSYHFRIGAQSDGNETKYNYMKSVKLNIPTE